MHIKELFLKNFRNISEQRIILNPKFNFIVGDNAQGKTNIIEAIYLLSYGKSFRTSEFRDLILWDGDASLANAKIEDKELFYEVQGRLNLEKKEFYKDGKRVTSIAKSVPLQVVLFSPEEILLLKSNPAKRRDYLDNLISKLEADYEKLVKDYKKVVSQRNNILSNESLTNDDKLSQLEVWNDQQINIGTKLVEFRKKWIDKINLFLSNQHESVAKNNEKVIMEYAPFCGPEILDKNIHQAFKKLISEKQEEELIRLQTLVGPQKDDFFISINGHDAKHFASQGQQRTIIIAMKMTEMELYYQSSGSYPLFLLDDVTSELDENRNKFFFEYLTKAKGQVFVTSTTPDDIKLSNIREYLTLVVAGGEVQVQS